MLYWWFPCRFDMVRMGFLVFLLKYVHRHILLANRSKSCKGCCLICVSFVTGVGMNLSPFARKLIWSFVSSLFERFFMFFWLAFIVIFARFCKHHTTFFYFRYELCTSQFSSSSPAGPGLILYHHQVLSIDPAGPCVPPLILFLLILQSS